MSKKKNEGKKPSLLFVVALVVIIVTAFVSGTFVGFKKGVQVGAQLTVLSGCHVVDCDQLGIDAVDADVCEVCLEEDEYIVKTLAG